MERKEELDTMDRTAEEVVLNRVRIKYNASLTEEENLKVLQRNNDELIISPDDAYRAMREYAHQETTAIQSQVEQLTKENAEATALLLDSVSKIQYTESQQRIKELEEALMIARTEIKTGYGLLEWSQEQIRNSHILNHINEALQLKPE